MKRFEIILILVTLLVVVSSMQAQQTCQPRMEQDPSLNNLVHPEGYETAEPGALGQVIRRGTGAQQMVLIAGAGFGAEI